LGVELRGSAPKNVPPTAGHRGSHVRAHRTSHVINLPDLTSTLVPSSLPLLQRHLAAAAERLHVPVERGCSRASLTRLTTMSGKIKSKDLSYDSSLPPFLQRLRAQNTGYGDDGDPDRQERPQARPKRAKDPDDDDGPTFVDESGELVSKADYEKQLKGDVEGEETGGNVTSELKGDGKPEASSALPADSGPRVEQKLTDGAAVKKRKAAKVIGDEDEDDSSKATGAEKGTAPKTVKKAKKKAKPIKLAFDDDEGT
jgi:hypothetical protein